MAAAEEIALDRVPVEPVDNSEIKFADSFLNNHWGS
jgi:hypothetical protein